MRSAASCCVISTTALPFLWRRLSVRVQASPLPPSGDRCGRWSQYGRLPHGLARRPLLPRPTRQSVLLRRVMRAKALPDRVQAPLGLSSSTHGARSPPSDQPCRDFHGVRQGFHPPTCRTSPPDPLPPARAMHDPSYGRCIAHTRERGCYYAQCLRCRRPLARTQERGARDLRRGIPMRQKVRLRICSH